MNKYVLENLIWCAAFLGFGFTQIITAAIFNNLVSVLLSLVGLIWSVYKFEESRKKALAMWGYGNKQQFELSTKE